MQETKIVVGLGNPGKDYKGTRHNIGFDVIDKLAKRLDIELNKKKFNAKFGSAQYGDDKLILLKPWQFINRSGFAVATAMGFYKVKLENLIVILDDMALPPGKLRIRQKGSSGGHNGLADIIEKLKTTEFSRLRVGIGCSDLIDNISYVLSRPDKDQAEEIDLAVGQAVEAILFWINNDIEETMNKFNNGN